MGHNVGLFSMPFVRRIVREGFRLMIESTCLGCGESRLVSHSDGSLEQWEQQHHCGEQNVRPAVAVG